MTAKERLYNLISDILKKGWEGEALKENEAILAAFMDGLSEKQGEALIETAENRFTSGKVSGLKGEPVTAMAWGIALMISMQGAKWQELKEKGAQFENGNPEDFLAGALLEGVPGDGLEWKWIELFAQQTKGKDADDAIKSFKSFALDKYLIPTGKVPRGMTERDAGSAEVIPAHGKTPAIKTSFILYFANDEDIRILGRKTISKFDMAILNGVISLVARGNIAITPAMAYRAAAGWNTEHEVTPKQEQAAQKSIERLRATFVQIDATEEVKAYCANKGVKAPKSWKYNDALLSCKAGEITQINGKKVKAYLFDNYDKRGNLKMPIIMEYAQISGQILALPMELADMPVSATESNIVLKNYLWVQIGAIKNKKTARRQEIAYEGIYNELGIDVSTSLGRKQAQRAREATESLLDNWKRKGAIKNYTIYTKDRKAAGIKVEA